MTKLSYLLVAAAAITIVTPIFAEDAPKKTGVTTGAARDEGRPQERRGEMRKEGDRERTELLGERRDEDRDKQHGEHDQVSPH
jgi:hypothetical protein